MRFHLDPTSSVPPFEQLRAQVAVAASTGELAAGEKLPTVRQLAAELGLAAGTVARAYRELEADGVVVTEGRRGTFVASFPLDRGRREDIDPVLHAYVDAVRRAGLTLPEATRLVEESWSR